MNWRYPSGGFQAIKQLIIGLVILINSKNKMEVLEMRKDWWDKIKTRLDVLVIDEYLTDPVRGLAQTRD